MTQEAAERHGLPQGAGQVDRRQHIVDNVYGNIVEAANPTGLLPVWDQCVDKAVVDKLGFKYNPTDAKQILTDAGY